MFLLYLYASIAGLGLLSLPSYGIWYQANYIENRRDFKIRRRTYEDDDCKEINWWDVDIVGKERTNNYDIMKYPLSLGLRIAGWPITLAYYIIKHSLLISSKVLAIPGKMLVQGKIEKTQADRFLAAGHREVEKILASK